MERKFILLSNFLKRRRINNVSDWILKLKFKSVNEVNQWCKSNGINNDLSLKSLFLRISSEIAKHMLLPKGSLQNDPKEPTVV